MRKYKSEIGFSFYFIAILIGTIIILSLVAILKDSFSISETIFLLFAYILVMLAYFFSIVYPLINTKYIVQDEKIIIKSGFYKKTILCNQIVEIVEKKSFNREPALSTRRLYIKYSDGQGKYWIGISPRNKADFIKNINATI